MLSLKAIIEIETSKITMSRVYPIVAYCYAQYTV